jgi:hypothetical protein
MNLSSRATFYLKFIHPWLVGWVLFYCFYDARYPVAVNGVIVGVVIAITGIFLVLCARVKKVSASGNTLIVSNFLKTCLIKKTDICEIKAIGPKKRFVSLRLKKRCIFGDEIIFTPPLDVLIKGDKSVHDFIHEHIATCGDNPF